MHTQPDTSPIKTDMGGEPESGGGLGVKSEFEWLSEEEVSGVLR